MAMHESGEMYLETIYVLSKKNKDVRAIDIATELNYSKPSVSVALANLKKEKYIMTDPKGYISLTDEGKAIATKIYSRHTSLSDFFISIGVDKDIAVEDACRIEHVISDETMDKINAFVKNSK
ncbi:MAG: metal-dependent transcriptional regulator [Thomasclavelia sp.]|nr:metal-dependent transcriptional regulator [Thomasclavelia sp.]